MKNPGRRDGRPFEAAAHVPTDPPPQGDPDAPRINALDGHQIHEHWDQRYRTAGNLRYFEDCLRHGLAPLLARTPPATVLDAGCGTGLKSELLASLGLSVLAVDKSDDALAIAHRRIAAIRYPERVRFMAGDLTALALEDSAVDAVVCWAVLMHMEDAAAAVSELARVIKPGGLALVSEGNCRSLQSRIARLGRDLGLGRGAHRPGPLGLDIWKDTRQGRLLIRHMDLRRLIALFEENGLRLKVHRAGQFTEAYALFSNRAVISAIQQFNNFWHRHVRLAGPAFGNILIFEKTTGRGRA